VSQEAGGIFPINREFTEGYPFDQIVPFHEHADDGNGPVLVLVERGVIDAKDMGASHRRWSGSTAICESRLTTLQKLQAEAPQLHAVVIARAAVGCHLW
jgi:hypothetical protein